MYKTDRMTYPFGKKSITTYRKIGYMIFFKELYCAQSLGQMILKYKHTILSYNFRCIL